MHHNYIEIFLVLVFIIAVAKLAGVLSQRLGQPAVLGEIAAGLILGPTLLAIAYWPIFPESSQTQLENEAVRKAIEGYAGNPDDVEEKAHELGVEAGRAVEGLDTLADLPEEQREIIGYEVTRHIQSYAHEQRTFMEDVIKVMAELGVLFLMFLAGVETDLKQMMRVGRVATFAALGGVILPMALGLAVTMILLPKAGFYTALFAGTILCATSVSISAQTLKELGKLKSKEGTTILGAAVIDDIVGIIVLSLVIAFNPAKMVGAASHEKQYETWQNWLTELFNLPEAASKVVGIILLIVAIGVFFSIFFLFGMKYFQKLMDFLARLPTSQGVLAFALAIALFYAWAAEYVGAVAAITGTYLAGVILAQTTYRREVEEKLGIITYSFFVPIFFINIGLEANARTLEGSLLWYTIAIAVAAVVAKAGGCFIGAKLGGFNMTESIRVGVGMVSRGEVGLIVASVGLSAGIIGRDIFSSMIIMVLVTTLVTPALLKLAFRGAPPDVPEGDE
jgi:Kef-type K+ transport system membrane component KefB